MNHQRAQVALRERVKELTCLYGIAKVTSLSDMSLEDTLEEIAKLVPPALLYSDIAQVRITLDDFSCSTAGFQDGPYKLSAEIVVEERIRGGIDVEYLEEKPRRDEGPFLAEERSLLNTIASEVALLVRRRQSEEERTRLQEQLRHADRLATIGQLAAGVAHELNEPLGNILGFAQLAGKCSDLPDDALHYVEKVVKASLHAREIIKKLLLFARQTPPRKKRVAINKVIEEALGFLESWCIKEGVEVVYSMDPDLPMIEADPAQLNQILVNLVVNAVHSMPDGGRLTVGTVSGDGWVSLVVDDSGIGMSDDVVKKAFTPFFTTKEIGKGTGLGLAVVHGIVTSHGGSIVVESKVGEGTRFEIRLPVSGLPADGGGDDANE